MSEVLLHHVECGPLLLLNTTAAPATVLTGLPGPDGDTHLCAQLATPVKHRLPATAEAADHPAAQFGRDAHGPFLWIYYVALHPRVPGTDLARPATNLPVDISYILDPSIGQADVLDANKMVWVATAFLDHLAGHTTAKAIGTAEFRSKRYSSTSSRPILIAGVPGSPARRGNAPPPPGDWRLGPRMLRCSSASTANGSAAAPCSTGYCAHSGWLASTMNVPKALSCMDFGTRSPPS